jgi:hypothetical protein
MKVHASAPPSAGTLRAGMVLLTLAAVMFPTFAFAQQQPPLAEVARQEAERRKTVKSTQKVITTKDLPESARRAPGAAPSGEAAPAAAPVGDHSAAPAADPKAPDAKAGAKPAAAAGSDAKDEAAWRGRMEAAREAVRRNEAFVDALQSRINALTRDFVNRDNPVQRAKIGDDRQKALAELERVRNDIELGKKQIADIEEEARKAGVPPGWLR